MSQLKDPPSEIGIHESVGRRIFSSRHFKGNIVKFRAFYHSRESILSVDRLDYAPPGFLKNLSEEAAQARGASRRFHGWARLTIMQVVEIRARVEADPISGENPYHANIHLSADVTDAVARKREAVRLARLSEYVPPDWNSER